MHFEGTFANHTPTGPGRGSTGPRPRCTSTAAGTNWSPQRGKRVEAKSWVAEPDKPRGLDFYDAVDGTAAHLANWIDCVRSREEPTCPVEEGVASADLAHLANAALPPGVGAGESVSGGLRRRLWCRVSLPFGPLPCPAAPLLALLLIAPVADGAGRRAPLTAPKPPTAADAAVLWHTDFPAAQADAAARGVPLVVLLTGEDWCGPCIDLRDGVFTRPAFARAAGDFSFVRFDSPPPGRSRPRPGRGPGRGTRRRRSNTARPPCPRCWCATRRACRWGVTGEPRWRPPVPRPLSGAPAGTGGTASPFATPPSPRPTGSTAPAKAAALHAGLAAVWAEPGAGAERRARAAVARLRRPGRRGARRGPGGRDRTRGPLAVPRGGGRGVGAEGGPRRPG